MHLPSVRDAVIPRPGPYKDTVRHLVPNPEYAEFWEHWYQTLRRQHAITPPVHATIDNIDPLFGNFGLRYHPVTHKPGYFHGGIDITARAKTKVYPILPGVLEYSGYGVVNGKYVLLSHPSVTTDDGFVLMSSVMHLRDTLVRFTSYQKMLREISLHNYPNIELDSKDPIGTVGDSGIVSGYHAHVHVQIELRNRKGEIILLDPALLFGFPSRPNISATTKSLRQFSALKDEHADIVRAYSLQNYWNEQ